MVAFVRKTFHSEISRQDINQNTVKWKRSIILIKTVTHSWRVRTKIKKQSKQVLNKVPRRKEGRHFLAVLCKIDTVLPVLIVALFQKLQMFRYKLDAMYNELNHFPSCSSVVFTIPSATSKPVSKLRTTVFCALRLFEQTKVVNSNVPHNSNLVSELHRNNLFKFKFCL